MLEENTLSIHAFFSSQTRKHTPRVLQHLGNSAPGGRITQVSNSQEAQAVFLLEAQQGRQDN